MFNFSGINFVLAKQNFHNQTWKVFLKNAETSFRRSDKIVNLSSSNVFNRCRYTESVLPLNPSLLSFYSEKKNFISIRNISKSKPLWSGMQSNQDKEKIKNYLFFGAIILSVIFVIYMFNTMQYHQDYVHIEPSEKKK